MPRAWQEILDHADQLARRFEDHEPDDEQAVADRVRDAREAGLPWAAIGAYLGTSGEAARRRYGRLIRE